MGEENMNNCLTLTRAVNILTSDNVIKPSICAEWDLPEVSLPIRYCEQTLREVAESNKKGDTNFFLAYFPGNMSLLRLREICGWDSAKPPYFCKECWWLEKEEEYWQWKKMPYWPKVSSPANFYLIDFKPHFPAINGWEGQEKEIARFGRRYLRASEDVFLFSILSVYKLTGKNAMSDYWWHWGKSISWPEEHVMVRFLADGRVSVSRPLFSDRHHIYLCVSLCRKFDF